MRCWEKPRRAIPDEPRAPPGSRSNSSLVPEDEAAWDHQALLTVNIT